MDEISLAIDTIIKKIDDIESKLNLLLINENIMGENHCIHEWEYPEFDQKTKNRLTMATVPFKIIPKCKKCGFRRVV